MGVATKQRYAVVFLMILALGVSLGLPAEDGTRLGDPRSVVRADLGTHEAGRGVSIYLWNLPPDRRLPLRAYAAGLTLKNGVPINYIEAIGLCEWMEVGFKHLLHFPRRRGGMDLCASAALPVSPYGNDVRLGLPVSTGP